MLGDHHFEQPQRQTDLAERLRLEAHERESKHVRSYGNLSSRPGEGRSGIQRGITLMLSNGRVALAERAGADAISAEYRQFAVFSQPDNAIPALGFGHGDHHSHPDARSARLRASIARIRGAATSTAAAPQITNHAASSAISLTPVV